MPPPLSSQQGSRAGLIAALVIFVILFLVSTFYAFSYYQKNERNEAAIVELKNTDKEWVNDPTTPEFTAARDAAKTRGGGAFEIKVAENQELSRALVGQALPTEQALNTKKGAIAEANKTLTAGGIQPKDRGMDITDSESVISAMIRYAQAYVKLEGEKKDAQANIAALQTEQQKLVQQHQTAIAAKDQEIQKAQAETQAEAARVADITKKHDEAVSALTAGTSQQIKAVSDALAAQQTIVAQKDQDIGRLRSEIEKLKAALIPFRMNARENIVRKPDGILTRVTADGYCYINRGVGDGVTVGLTFEVYDKIRGIPPLADGMSEPDTGKGAKKSVEAANVTSVAAVRAASAVATGNLDSELPKGKGSIEVVSVGPGHTSQCRVVHSEPGQTLTEGDIIGNLVYDPDRKFTFGIYGDFDLDGNGVATTSDTAVIKRLCEQWGGKVIILTKPEDVVVSLDFIVMGLEPKPPPGDPTDPQVADLIQKYKTLFDAYQAIRGKASDLHIPIMNQNRFLYYIGYFDQKTR